MHCLNYIYNGMALMDLLQSGSYNLRKIWAANLVINSDLSCFDLKIKYGNLFTNYRTVSFSIRTVLHGISLLAS